MRFCEHCNNMLYVNVDEEKRLVYYCKTCGHKDTIMDKGHSVCIVDDNKINDYAKYSQYINPYLKYDPCLPRVKNIICPCGECSKPKEAENEVIYIKYDATNMKFIYNCCHCNHFWTS